jgi:predicted PurR-regulated permease PerM
MSMTLPPDRRPVPWRTIFAVLLVVLCTAFAVVTLQRLGRIITWFVVAAFFAAILTPAVDILHHKVKMPRVLATLIVFLLGLAAMAGLLYAFIRPLVDQAYEFSDNLPQYVEEAKAGEGPVGELVKRYELDTYVERNQGRLREMLSGAGKPAAEFGTRIFASIAAFVTILVLIFLLLLEGPKLIDGMLRLVPPRHRDRVRRVARDSNRAITGYMFGNLAISVIAGVATYLVLWPLDVPFKGVLALWVAFADLIPLVGATLGAVVVSSVAFLDSTKTGIIVVVFFVIYQQFENHVLQVSIMSRTVDLNPLAVLLSVLVGVELFGILGALLAIPAGGVLQVICRDVYDENLGMLKAEPTIGADEIPISQVLEEEAADAATAAEDSGRALPPPGGATSVIHPPSRPETVEVPPAHGPTLPGPTAAT